MRGVGGCGGVGTNGQSDLKAHLHMGHAIAAQGNWADFARVCHCSSSRTPENIWEAKMLQKYSIVIQLLLPVKLSSN